MDRNALELLHAKLAHMFTLEQTDKASIHVKYKGAGGEAVVNVYYKDSAGDKKRYHSKHTF